MKRATIALRALLGQIASGVGAEGAFLIAGTLGLAYAASYVHPAGAVAVVGLICLLVGVALAVPDRKPPDQGPH